jgi:hypothetical protein
MAKILFIGLLILATFPARAADVNGDEIETVLFPLAFNSTRHAVPGAFGTVWSGEVWMDNRNSSIVLFLPPCDVPIVCPEELIRAGRTEMLRPFQYPERGLVLHIQIQHAARLTFSNRIFEHTLRAQPRGVDIPVIREGEFFDSVKTFPAVPAGDDLRIGVRVYDPWLALRRYIPVPFPPLEAVRIEIFDEVQSLRGSAILDPELQNASGDRFDVLRPGFASNYDLAESFPVVRELSRVHVRLTPVPEGAQYWGMVSVTDNETQTVSIITAQ